MRWKKVGDSSVGRASSLVWTLSKRGYSASRLANAAFEVGFKADNSILACEIVYYTMTYV
jgi:hypothetical protein